MADLVEFENRAGIARVTCGWKKPHLPLEAVLRYWRDVHSPAISRRAGLFEYRHSPFDRVRTDLFAAVAGVEYACPADQQLMWQSDVRYLDDAALAAFGVSPDGAVKAALLADIELLVERSTTYRALGKNARTYVDLTGNPNPVARFGFPHYGIFLRKRADEATFRAFVEALAQRWSSTPGVLRLRLNLFEVPDMEAEKKAGYPIKTHPAEQQYQAWIDLVLATDEVADTLIAADDGLDYGSQIAAMHAYPVSAVYTFVYGGRATLLGLRGFAAYDAIHTIGATNQMDPQLLEWMYGRVAEGGPLPGGAP